MDNRDRKDALIDALKLRAGIISKASLATHPSADRFSEENVLTALAETCAALALKRPFPTPGAAFGAGIGTGDFKGILSDLARAATIQRLTAHARHRPLCSINDLLDFKPTSFPSADFDLTLNEPGELGDFGEEVSIISSTGSGLTANIRSFGKNIAISRQTIRNDDVGLIVGLFSNVGAAAARHEAAMVYALIEGNPTLGDGESMFHTDHGNIEAAALDAASLGSAMGRLRNMLTPAGALADLDTAYLVVASGLELAALTLVNWAGAAIKVVASPWLASGRWYLMADPAQSPVIGLLHLKGSRGGVIVGPRKSDIVREGIDLGVRFDVGVVAKGRVGIVRGGL